MVQDLWTERFRKDALPIISKKFKPLKVYIYGSRIKGTADEFSDIDVIIVSEAFRKIPFVKRMEQILNLTKFPKHVDYLCYTPEEFEKIQHTSSVIQDAMNTCLEVTP